MADSRIRDRALTPLWKPWVKSNSVGSSFLSSMAYGRMGYRGLTPLWKPCVTSNAVVSSLLSSVEDGRMGYRVLTPLWRPCVTSSAVVGSPKSYMEDKRMGDRALTPLISFLLLSKMALSRLPVRTFFTVWWNVCLLCQYMLWREGSPGLLVGPHTMRFGRWCNLWYFKVDEGKDPQT